METRCVPPFQTINGFSKRFTETFFLDLRKRVYQCFEREEKGSCLGETVKELSFDADSGLN